MFNPLYPFTNDVLEATIKRGCLYFVRNTYKNAFDHFDTDIKDWFIISHYDDMSKAKAHYNSLTQDKHRYLYDWHNQEEQERLKKAASTPEGYKIYSAYFLPDYKNKITPVLKEKINRYMYRHTNWKPNKGDTVNVDISLQFGYLYATLSFEGQYLEIKFEDIELNK